MWHISLVANVLSSSYLLETCAGCVNSQRALWGGFDLVFTPCIALRVCLQDSEANLDITMDRMRQDATESTLTASLKKVLEMMEKIKSG